MSYLVGRQKNVNLIDLTPNPDVGYAIGIIRSLNPKVEIDNVIREPGTNTRSLSILRAGFIVPKLTLNWDFHQWHPTSAWDYILNHCMPSAQATRSKHMLRYTDGYEDIYVGNSTTVAGCLVDSFRISCKSGETLKCSADIIAENLVTSPDPGKPTSWDSAMTAEKAVWSDQIVELPAASPISNWLNWDFGVSHGVESIQTGQSKVPTDTIEKEVEYSGTLVLARKSDEWSHLINMMSDSQPASIVFKVKDKAGSPVTKTFTFTNNLYRTSNVELVDLNLSIERIMWSSRSLAIT